MKDSRSVPVRADAPRRRARSVWTLAVCALLPTAAAASPVPATVWLGFAGSGVAPLAEHEGLRCGERLVELGERTAEVELRCGAPKSRERWTESRLVGRSLVLVPVEEWIYDQGYGSFPRLLRFENQRLVDVRALRR